MTRTDSGWSCNNVARQQVSPVTNTLTNNPEPTGWGFPVYPNQDFLSDGEGDLSYCDG